MPLKMTVEDFYLWGGSPPEQADPRFVGHVRLRIQLDPATHAESFEISVPFENARSFRESVAWALRPIMHHGLELAGPMEVLRHFCRSGTTAADPTG